MPNVGLFKDTSLPDKACKTGVDDGFKACSAREREMSRRAEVKPAAESLQKQAEI